MATAEPGAELQPQATETEPEPADASDTASDAGRAPNDDRRAAVQQQEPTGQTATPTMRRSILVLSVLLAVALATAGFLGWRLIGANRSADQARAELATSQHAADSRKHAEQVALDYARGAAEMDYKDLTSWKKRLTANTSPELSKRLEEAATSMEQIFVPLQWVSEATSITATVRTGNNGAYVVNSFVSVMTKNKQATNGIQSTATYTVTVNEKDDWRITDVGGVESALKADK